MIGHVILANQQASTVCSWFRTYGTSGDVHIASVLVNDDFEWSFSATVSGLQV